MSERKTLQPDSVVMDIGTADETDPVPVEPDSDVGIDERDVVDGGETLAE